MNRRQLWHAIRAACSIADIDSVIIVGSQSILGSFDEEELPRRTTLSLEVDVLPDIDDTTTLVELSDLIEGVGGELSTFQETHGFALDGVDLTTSILPEGWRDRLVPVSNESTRDIVTGRQYTGWCLDPADLCVAKLCASREKDREFVSSLIQAGLVDWQAVKDRLGLIPAEHADIAQAVLREFSQT
ncbi:MAG: hypothetical protein LBL55_10370 [Propionibacteriaceae bacterium]|jgi:hypothetical protein|nr:hypothetical protein [Propionibacteriaceae bacterium]